MIKALQVTEEKEPEIISVAQALAAIKEVDKGDGGTYNLNGTYYVKGIVCRIQEISTQYGNATYWISDDGKAYGVTENKKSTTDPEHDFECYSVYWYGNKPWADGNAQVAVGDDVVVCGQLTKYGSIYETLSKKAWVYSLNGKTE